jgi:hypothetical protein
MNKQSMRKIGRYLRDFSIVVAGIAVTLYVNDRIGRLSEKKEMTLYLNTLKLELEENLKIIDDHEAKFDQSIAYAHYLSSHDKKSLNPDSINSYGDIYHNINSFIYKSSAYEMFKASGTMRLVGNKEVLKSIWDLYSEMEELKFDVDGYYQYKKEESIKEARLDMDVYLNTIPMYNFYSFGMDFEMKSLCREMSQHIKEVLSKF